MTLFDMLVRSAAGAPGAPAIGYREQTISYGQLLALVEGCATGLAGLRLRKRARVAVLLPNCPPFIIAYFAINRLGATVVPLNVLYRPDEARYILADCEAEAIITAEPFRPLVAALRPHLPRLKHVVMVTEGAVEGDELDFRDLCRHAPQAHPAQSDRETAVILYTSGTTGRPKGAMLTNTNLVANAQSCSGVLDVTAGDCLLSALPLFHSFAATVTMLLPILVGGRMHLTERFVPAHTLQLLEDARVTIFAGVPSMFGLMLQVPRENRPSLSALRTCISGGSPLPPDVWTAFEAAFDVKMAEGYGLTEAAPVVTVNPPMGVRKVGSIGPVIPAVAVKIIDDHGRAVPVGEIGELCVRGPNVMKGYLNRPADTKDVLRSGWLHTGDLARSDDDGYLYIVGRKKELIIVGGLNVYPGEVERVLVEHPAVLEAAAFGVSDPSRGEAVWASIVLRPDTVATEKELQTLCREKLASYKVPRGIDIRVELPKNALGKVMRHVLSQEIVARQARPTPVG
jgi:long-chain acyl-CoA synthetase